MKRNRRNSKDATESRVAPVPNKVMDLMDLGLKCDSIRIALLLNGIRAIVDAVCALPHPTGGFSVLSEDSIVRIPIRLVASTGSFFEALSVENRQVASAVPDQP
jgi:hypothetical protein